jgi:hypothetical protein
MGILDQNTLRLLRDGKVLKAIDDLQSTGKGVAPAERERRLQVTVHERDGSTKTKRVLIRRVTS